jgi:hypothetical protein
MVHDVEIEELKAARETSKKRAIKATRMFRRKLWHKRVKKAHCALLRHPRRFWSWASMTAKWKLKSAAAGIQPIRDKEGVLKTTLPEQLEVWRDHFGTLAADQTGNSQDPKKWWEIAKDKTLPALQGLDGDFMRKYIWKALQGMKTYRAPGGDGIPTNFYRAALLEKERLAEWVDEQARLQGDAQGEPPPGLFMTKALVDLLNNAWKTGVIADDWVESIGSCCCRN